VSLFTITEKIGPAAFITTFEKGYITHDPSIRICKINYDSHHYHDALFAEYSLALPEKMTHAIKKRKAEFLASRIATQALFKDENIHITIPPAAGTSPQWPEGWTGSISHTNQCAVAIITPSKAGLCIGVDTEYLHESILLETAAQFTDNNERTLLTRTLTHYPLGLLLTFSGKESLYKAIFPSINKMLDFDTASISQLNPDTHSFTLELTKTLAADMPAGRPFNGHYELLENNHIITLVTAMLFPDKTDNNQKLEHH
jgi:4'-phosphopantetheinyl transferase EntD